MHKKEDSSMLCRHIREKQRETSDQIHWGVRVEGHYTDSLTRQIAEAFTMKTKDQCTLINNKQELAHNSLVSCHHIRL